MDYRMSDFLDAVDIEAENLLFRAGVGAPRAIWMRDESHIMDLKRLDMDFLIDYTSDSGVLLPYTRGLDPSGAMYGLYMGIISDNGTLEISFILARTRGLNTAIWTEHKWVSADGDEIISSYDFTYSSDPDENDSIEDDEKLPFEQTDNHIIRMDFVPLV